MVSLPCVGSGAQLLTFATQVFAAGFSESSFLDMNAAYPPTKPSATDCYDYESDSDLEDEEGDEVSPTHSVDSPEGQKEEQKEESEVRLCFSKHTQSRF